jgi:hypothetical protein
MSYPTESWPAALVGAVVESNDLFNKEGGRLTGDPKGGDSDQTKVRSEVVESVPVFSTSFAIPFECLELDWSVRRNQTREGTTNHGEVLVGLATSVFSICMMSHYESEILRQGRIQIVQWARKIYRDRRRS